MIFGVIEVLVTVSHLKFAFNPTLKGVRLSDMMPSELEPSNSSPMPSFCVMKMLVALLLAFTAWTSAEETNMHVSGKQMVPDLTNGNMSIGRNHLVATSNDPMSQGRALRRITIPIFEDSTANYIVIAVLIVVLVVCPVACLVCKGRKG